jgi:hypothetical protein
MKVTRNYIVKGVPSHYYQTEWTRTELFCPKCGKQPVFEEKGEGDYYVGADHCCTACGHNFTLQGSGPDDMSRQIVEQLRSGVTAEPQGRHGG